MQQQGSEYSSPSPYNYHNYDPSFSNPNSSSATGELPSSNPIQSSYASAPPYSLYSSYPAYSQNNEVITPSAPSYSLPQLPSFQPLNYSYDTYQSLPNSNPAFPSPYEGAAGRYDQGDLYAPAVTSEYGKSAGFEQDFYGKKPEIGYRYDQGGLPDNELNEGVYAYDGGKSEPYGARGTAPSRSSALFDDYGRAINLPSGGKEQSSGNAMKVVRAVPKVDEEQDGKNGVQKFRVKLLAEGSGQSTMDVLCQVGLDGIRMLDPTTNRTLRIYSLDTVIRCEVLDSSIFAFWSKSSVDIEPRRIRLKSNSYTTSTILDLVTAATVQFKEMGGNGLSGGKGLSDTGRLSEQPTEKKKGLVDWMNLIKPGDEEKDYWVPDEAVSKCPSCGTDFGAFVRRHHCRNCGDIFCDKCTQGRIALTTDENAQQVRVCDRCMAEASQRLSYAKKAVNKPVGLQGHEDLARKLQEEMDKNRKLTSGSSSSSGSEGQMREVACPICTVHLQVQVPSSGSETIECGVCQHPFLVSAH